MALIEVKDLAVGYGSQTVAENISFEINEGDYLCIIGENGSGKTTLFKTLLGLQKPLKGSLVKDESLNDSGIGYLPQKKETSDDFPATVFEIVMSGFQNRQHFFYTRQQREKAKDNLERMGMAEYERRSFHKLSGGQQQRVLLARALCATDRILFLDEPTASLDPTAARDFYDLLEKLNKQGITIVMISHDEEAAFRYASHILHIGLDVYYGTKNEYLERRSVQ